jgi:hypothetical protein
MTIKMKLKIIISVCFAALIFFNNSINQKLLAKTSFDSNMVSGNDNPEVLLHNRNGTKCQIILYDPHKLTVAIKSQRPTFNNNCFFCVPAAFTSKTPKQIAGIFIERGNIINSLTDKEFNGTCIISQDSIKIMPSSFLNKNILDNAIKYKNSLFQQFLLINHSEIVPCLIFQERVNLRRALIQFDNYFCVGESNKPVTILDFQESLKSIGAINALYLDMGTYSEGWYKNHAGEKVKIGEEMINTDKQSNWLVYEKIK